jgi:predicted ATPase
LLTTTYRQRPLSDYQPNGARRWFWVQRHSASEADKLGTVLARTLTPGLDAALLAEMLSLPNDGRYPTLEIAPQQRRQKTLEALTTQLEVLSRSSPVLMIFEDVHMLKCA